MSRPFHPDDIDLFERRPDGDVGRGAPSRSVRTVAAILPNGRVLWLGVGPAPATAASLAHLARSVQAAFRRRRAALRRQHLRIRRLARLSAGAAERVSRAKVVRSQTMRRRIAADTNGLDLRLAQAAGKLRKQTARRAQIEQESVRRMRRRDLWDKAVLATSLPLFAAYGETGRPFAAGNLALLLSTLLWLVGDDVVDWIFGPEEPSPYPVADLDVWSYVAPFGNLLGGHWLLADFQHERFVTGLVRMPPDAFFPPEAVAGEVEYQHAVAVRLDRAIGAARFQAFSTHGNVPVVATVRTLRFSSDPALGAPRSLGLTAQVIGGNLLIFFRAAATDLRALPTDPLPPVVESLDIAWMVDTAPTGGDGN